MVSFNQYFSIDDSLLFREYFILNVEPYSVFLFMIIYQDLTLLR